MRTRLVIANGPVPTGLSFDAVSHDCSHPCVAYIGHIIDYWDSLADTTVFARSEHVNQSLLETVSSQEWQPRVTMEIHLASISGGCPQLALLGAWKHLFNTEPPRTIRIPLMGTRIVSREKVQARPHAFYQGLQEDMQIGTIPPETVEALWDYLF